MVDAADLKSAAPWAYGFDSRSSDRTGTEMIPDYLPELQEAFDLWIERGSHELPTMQQCIDNGEIDMAMLHHLARFIWMRADGYVSSEARTAMMKEYSAEVTRTPESALNFLIRAGILDKNGQPWEDRD